MQYHHDLQRLLDAVNAVYFDSTLDINIEWFRPTMPRKGARTSAYYAYYNVETNTIRMNPILNARWVPQFFVTYIIFHECLHKLYPPRLNNGEHVLLTMDNSWAYADKVEEWHTDEFLMAEARFAHIKRAEAWEDKNNARLMRSRCEGHPRASRRKKTDDDDE